VVDDTFTSGDTLISLIQHIVDGGGRVVAATTLADGRWQNYLKPRAEDVKIILDKLGLNEAEFHHEIGIPRCMVGQSRIVFM
jgi:orotate phosphoribosyltransferase